MYAAKDIIAGGEAEIVYLKQYHRMPAVSYFEAERYNLLKRGGVYNKRKVKSCLIKNL